ncbi:hypothetical protein [Streptomyces candidus]|uniref:Uncharacterized protein n=1 Tax=Streptomyces candidus TaxID=67283 RepID=A0A7X0HAS7_9ACTN|nr:hypothetical protein [Streptomyces candidus]MBB6434241.1 hypothetical protein [Streptomyces candidus]GHH37422.1 hypothetical protein GCM10018773_14160 [Streptomyces candidus]
MPLIPQEPQIYESAQGPRATPAASRTAPTPRPVPGPRPAAPRPGPARAARPGPPVQRKHAPQAAPAVPAGNRPAPQAAPAASAPTPDGPQIQLVPVSAGGALDAAGEAVDLLLDSGRAPGDVLVLTTGEQHPWAEHELSFGEASYWAQHDARDDVFYADIGVAERATARPVVVVAVNEVTTEDLARTLPAARARAGALLIVCGDPQRINAALGAGV